MVLVLGEEVVMEETFDEALASAVRHRADRARPDATPGGRAVAGRVPSPTPEAPTDSELEELIEKAGRASTSRLSRLWPNGDFEEYARLIEKLGRLLSEAQD